MKPIDNAHLLSEIEKIATGIGKMFPGLCEVVVHDLTEPEHAIRCIENNLSGRQVGDSATELGLRRIADSDYPSVIQNYANVFPDGRPAKSTSIGIKNAQGRYIAALCLNLDVSMLSAMNRTLEALINLDAAPTELETLRGRTTDEIREIVESFAAERASTPRSLHREAKKQLVRRLHRDGYFDARSSANTIGDLLGVSRATVYNYTKNREN